MLTKEQETVLRDIAPIDGFAYFAGIVGNTELNLHGAHAAIYAGNNKFSVVGVTADLEPYYLECDNLKQAIGAYKKLLEGQELLAERLFGQTHGVKDAIC